MRTQIDVPSDNPLRDPRDRRLPRIAGPCSLVIFGVTGDDEALSAQDASTRALITYYREQRRV